MKQYRMIAIWGACAITGLFVLLILICTHRNLTISYHSYAADADGNIYLGRDSLIYVISPEGETIRTIDARTSRGYDFTIEGNTLYVLDGTLLYKLDLYGEERSEPVDYYELDVSHKPKLWISPRREFTAGDGTKYYMRAPFLRVTIFRQTRDGPEPVYRMPPAEYAARLILAAVIISAFIVIPIQLAREYGKNQRNRRI